MSVAVDRGFQRIGSGLIHFREAGIAHDAPPLVMIHGGPGSSAGLVPIIAALSQHRHVIAPDLPGQGDSDPLLVDRPSIVSYAEALLAFLDARGIDRFDLYGHHSGAQIACELSIARPAAVRRLVLDGIALFSPEQRREFALRYAPPMVPQADGAHLLWAWNFARNLTRFFPHYERDQKFRLSPETILPSAAVTGIAIDLLKVWATYHLLYEAAFTHSTADRLPHVLVPTVVFAINGDPLAEYAIRVADLLPESRTIELSREQRAARILEFLSQS